MRIDGEEMKHVGSCCVDSGQIMIVDPCYIYPDDRSGNGEQPTLVKFCKPGSKTPYLDLIDGWDYNNHQEIMDVHGIAMNFSTYWGDGVYPVYADIDDTGKVKGVYIDFYGEVPDDY